ncbi:hypothetical protein ACFQX7_06505 [Luedemannella flava]
MTTARVVPAEVLPASGPRAGLVSTSGDAFARLMAEFEAVTERPGDTERLLGLDRLGSGVRPFQPQVIRRDDSDLLPVRSGAAALTDRLRELGMPAHLAVRSRGGDPWQAVVSALSDLPTPPAAPTEAGDVLVIVGERDHALAVARTLAPTMHLDPSRIMVVGPSVAGTGLHASRRLSGPSEVRRRARQLHRADVPHLVVLDTTFGDDAWAREVLRAIGASAVWAVVDAGRKTSAIARALRGLGRVDGLAVYGVPGCDDPATVLGLDVPMAMVMGEPATPQAWAALLAPRLIGAVTREDGGDL